VQVLIFDVNADVRLGLSLTVRNIWTFLVTQFDATVSTHRDVFRKSRMRPRDGRVSFLLSSSYWGGHSKNNPALSLIEWGFELWTETLFQKFIALRTSMPAVQLYHSISFYAFWDGSINVVQVHQSAHEHAILNRRFLHSWRLCELKLSTNMESPL